MTQELDVFQGGGALAVGGASISATGAEIAVATAEEYTASLLQLLAVDTAVGGWSLGDFIVYGKENYPEEMKATLDSIGETKRAKEAEKVARTFPREVRARYISVDVPYSYFRELAGLGTTVACSWLDKAFEENLTLPELRKAIKGADADTRDAVPNPVLRLEDADTQPGWLYSLGPHKLLCADSTSLEMVTALLGGELAAMVWTDPPYGVTYTGTQRPSTTRANVDQHIANDELTDEALLAMLVGAWQAAIPNLYESAPIYAAGPSGVNSKDFIQSFLDAGCTFRQTLVWKKNRMVFGYQDYHYNHESIFYGYAPGPLKGRHAKVNGRESLWQGTDSDVSVIECDLPHRSDDHPTQKPVDLIKPMILNGSEPGEIVLDLFAGSGSTMIAAEETGRRAFMVELDPRYCDVIRRRWAAYEAAHPTVIEGVATPA